MTKESRLLIITIVLSLPKPAARVYMSRESKPDFSGRPGHGTVDNNNIIVLRRDQ